MQSMDLFGGERCQYLVVAEPDPQTKANVKSLKAAMARQIDIGEHNRRAEPHISLNFSKESTTDVGDELADGLKRILAQAAPFEVSLNGLNDWSHSITWKIDDAEPIRELARQIMQETGLKNVETPHLTLARGINTANVGVTLEPFALYGRCVCRSISLLRQIGDGPYTTLVRIDLNAGSDAG